MLKRFFSVLLPNTFVAAGAFYLIASMGIPKPFIANVVNGLASVSSNSTLQQLSRDLTQNRTNGAETQFLAAATGSVALCPYVRARGTILAVNNEEGGWVVRYMSPGGTKIKSASLSPLRESPDDELMVRWTKCP